MSRKEILDKFKMRGRKVEPVVKEKYISCPDLRKVAIFDHQAIYCCCLLGELRNEAPYVKFSDADSPGGGT